MIILASHNCICADNITGEHISDTPQSSQLMDDKVKKESKTATDAQIEAGIEMLMAEKFSKAQDIFNNVLKSDSRNVQAQYFLGIIEYEEGNTEKARIRFQIAHDCLPYLSNASKTSIDDKKIQLEFSDKYETSVYYKDGWYIKPKRGSTESNNIHLLDVNSNYRINMKPKSEKDSLLAVSGIIGSIILLSFFAAR